MTEAEKLVDKIMLAYSTMLLDEKFQYARPPQKAKMIIEQHPELKNLGLFSVSNSICPKCGCNKMTGDGSKSWCLNEKCDFVEAD